MHCGHKKVSKIQQNISRSVKLFKHSEQSITNLIQCCMFDSKILNTKGILVGQNVSKNNTGWFLRYLKLNCCVVQLHIGPLGEPRINKILGGLNIFIACKKQGHRISMAKSVGKKIISKTKYSK